MKFEENFYFGSFLKCGGVGCRRQNVTNADLKIRRKGSRLRRITVEITPSWLSLARELQRRQERSKSFRNCIEISSVERSITARRRTEAVSALGMYCFDTPRQGTVAVFITIGIRQFFRGAHAAVVFQFDTVYSTPRGLILPRFDWLPGPILRP